MGEEKLRSLTELLIDETGTLASLSLVHKGSLVMVPARAGVSLNRAVLAARESRT
jgi:hypothetical protein